jgi:hypothetical protein
MGIKTKHRTPQESFATRFHHAYITVAVFDRGWKIAFLKGRPHPLILINRNGPLKH